MRTQPNRKAIMQSTLVSMIIVAVVIFIILFGAFRFFPIATLVGTSQACRVEGLIDTAAYTAKEESFLSRVFQNANFKSSCPVTSYYVKFDDFKTLSPIEVERLKTKELYAQISLTSDKEKAAYNAEKFVAEQLVDCYNRFEGLTIFPPTFTVTNMERENDNSFFGYLKQGGRYIVAFGSPTFEAAYAPPTFCSVCAKIHFDAEFAGQYAGDEYFLSSERYLRSTTRFRQTGVTLYEHIDKGRYKLPEADVDVLERFIFTPEAGSYAVLYYRKYDYKMTATEMFVTAAKFVNPYSLAIMGVATTLRVYSETELHNKNLEFLEEQRKLRENDPIVHVKKDTKIGLDTKIRDKGFTTGIASVFNQAHATYGIYRWFMPTLNNNYAKPDEHGVAIIPYADAIVQCDFVANSYGSVQIAKPQW
jgi:hypothetical protein